MIEAEETPASADSMTSPFWFAQSALCRQPTPGFLEVTSCVLSPVAAPCAWAGSHSTGASSRGDGGRSLLGDSGFA